MKQKLALACTLVHQPEVVLLDEPTTGVDPVSRREFWKLLSHFLDSGITILMTTPYLDEAERCHRVALVHDGRTLALDTPGAPAHVVAGRVDRGVSRRRAAGARPRAGRRTCPRRGLRRAAARVARQTPPTKRPRSRQLAALTARAGLPRVRGPRHHAVARRRVHRQARGARRRRAGRGSRHEARPSFRSSLPSRC